MTKTLPRGLMLLPRILELIPANLLWILCLPLRLSGRKIKDGSHPSKL